MRSYCLIICLLAGSMIAKAQNLLSGKYAAPELKQLLVPQSKWTPFPHLNDRAGWAKADPASGTAIIAKAEGFINYEWPGVPAIKSLQITRNGNRNEYEVISFKKREVLGTLLIAEIYENKGRFIDPIINGIWSICEESYWGSPAHLPKGPEYLGLHDVSEPFVELFSAETATFLAWVDYFLGEKLDAVSPQIRKRIYNETNRRIFEPLMTKPHGFMTSNANGRRPNNWNPWICSNWLNAVLLLEKDETKRVAAVSRILVVLDNFLNPYPADGGCDEGPGYWGAAAASLYDNIALLNLASNNAFTYVYKDEKVRNMGQFIYKAQISEKYFLNFADADPQPGMAASMIYRYGKDISDPAMMEFGAYYMTDKDKSSLGRFHYFRNFFSLFMQEEFDKAAKGLPLPGDVWWPDLQVMVSRDQAGSTKGFFVAAKGGNNDESHNHNDIGNYVVYYDGLPVLIDIGRGSYTGKTFSSKRYEIWYNCSDYHNVPTVNGKTQPPGAKFKAGNVAYKTSASTSQISMDIAPSYPADAGIIKWQRSIKLNKGKNVQVDDAMELKTAGDYTEHLMTCFPVEIVKPGTLVVHAKQDFFIHYPAKRLQATIERVPLEAMEDKGVKEKWGEEIYRINLKSISPAAKENIAITISK